MNAKEEIDIRELLNLFLRNKFLIASLTSLSCLLGVIYAFSIDRTWQGLIQIVISSQENTSSLKNAKVNFGAYSGISNLLTEGGNSIKTQVNIIQSPSVLLPVFEYFKDEKRKDGKKVDDLKFYDWKKDNLKVELTRGTSIVNFFYKDTDKKRILNVLNKVSSTYENYAGLKRSKNLDNAINYLKGQIKIYKNKSINSLRTAGEYAINNELFLEGSPNIIESKRVKTINSINTINQQINKLESSNITDDEVITLAQQNFLYKKVLEDLYLIEKQIYRLRSIYKENDEEILKRIEERDRLINFIKMRLLGLFKTNKFLAEASVISSKRPKEKLLKYQELTTEAKKDSLNLSSLQNELRIISLEKARESKPWEIITKPTVFDTPIGPKRKKIAFISFFIGIFISSIFAILIERFSSIIYKYYDLKPFLSYPLLLTIPSNDEFSFLKKLSTLLQGNSFNKIEDLKEKIINIIYIGSINESISSKLISQINLNLTPKKINIKEKLDLDNINDINILVSTYGKLSKNDIIEFNKNIIINRINLKGIIMLTD